MRSVSRLLIVGGMVLAAFLTGCGGGGGGGGGGSGGDGGGGSGGGGDHGEAVCLAICEEQKAQDCNSISDCAVECADDAARNAETGCAGEYIAFGACVQAMPDICDDEMAACGTELDAYWACVNKFCAANPDSDRC